MQRWQHTEREGQHPLREGQVLQKCDACERPALGIRDHLSKLRQARLFYTLLLRAVETFIMQSATFRLCREYECSNLDFQKG